MIRLRPKYPNYIWVIDFVHDKLSNGHAVSDAMAQFEPTATQLANAIQLAGQQASVLDRTHAEQREVLLRLVARIQVVEGGVAIRLDCAKLAALLGLSDSGDVVQASTVRIFAE
ncbi:MAG: hypothetical protein AAFR75_09385, partial [Pseudomonadota bacterium]